jgi:hypothetical protein
MKPEKEVMPGISRKNSAEEQKLGSAEVRSRK